MTKTLLAVALAPLLLLGCMRSVRLPPARIWAVPQPLETRGPDGLSRRGSPWGGAGSSVQGRVIRTTTFGGGPHRVLLLGSIHGDETEGLSALDRVLADLRTAAPETATFLVVRDMNPDGTARRTRTNARGVDLNRNWPAANFRRRRRHGAAPLSEPETRAVHRLLGWFDPELVIVFHSIRRGPFVNHDGPRPRTERIAQAFSEGASLGDRRWRVVGSMGYPTPGSLGSYAGRDRGVPILTIEFDRGQSAQEARIAATAGILAACAALHAHDSDRRGRYRPATSAQ